MTGEYDELIVTLTTVSERLDDRIMTLLRDAIDAGLNARPPAEKTLTRARSAVDKAIGLLVQLDDGSGDESDPTP